MSRLFLEILLFFEDQRRAPEDEIRVPDLHFRLDSPVGRTDEITKFELADLIPEIPLQALGHYKSRRSIDRNEGTPVFKLVLLRAHYSMAGIG